MSEQEWKPGDVAMVPGGPGKALLCGDGTWVTERHGVRHDANSFARFNGVRPLITIDLDDRAQVERLAALLVTEGATLDDGGVAHRGLEAALREFARPTPPRPDEPTGVGAVIEDAEGATWVRVHGTTSRPWTDESGQWRAYADVNVVTVLSEGVAP